MRKVLLVLVLLALVIGGFFGWRFWKEVFGPGVHFPEQQKVLLIPKGADFAQVMDSLRVQDLVEDEKALRWLAKQKQYIGKVRPGCWSGPGPRGRGPPPTVRAPPESSRRRPPPSRRAPP